jgi:hypothetical protein
MNYSYSQMFMNINTGTVDTVDGWYPYHPDDEKELVPVVRNAMGNWEEGEEPSDVRYVYTVGVGSSTYRNGKPAPDKTCGHAHRTHAAAEKCGANLYQAKTVRGSWQACAAWHNWYVMKDQA